LSKSIDTQGIQAINALEKTTGSRIMDWIVEGDTIYVVVPAGKVGAIVGKGGANIRKFNELTGKTVKVYGHSEKLEEFANNLTQNALQSMELKEADGEKVLHIKVDKSKKPLIVGKSGRNIKVISELLKRRFGIDRVVL
jgi:N utilization substance protein A